MINPRKLKVTESNDRYYITVETSKCKYGQSYLKSNGTLKELKERFIKFYNKFE